MKPIHVTQDNVDQFLCVRIFGGLGNQMFQYAAALAQAKRLNAHLLLDIVGSQRLDHAAFGLAQFPIKADLWDQNSLAAPTLLGKLTGRDRKKQKHGGNWPGERFRHDGLDVNADIFKLKTGSYLNGYFQSEDYFAAFEDDIRAAFNLSAFKQALDPQSTEWAKAPKAVSVHIRRGDYVHDLKALKIHGILEDDYYNRAATLMSKLVPDCKFLIFSDDREAADALTQSWPNRIVMPKADRFCDLSLMSQCSHHIVANSSFSWWGAWLDRTKDKHVIAPRRWYTREHMQTTYIDDICPKGWILI